MELSPLQSGIHNLLFNCAELNSGDRLLVVSEDPALGWYDPLVSEKLVIEARKFGVETKLLRVNGPDEELGEDALKYINDATCVIFLARIGDQNRFEPRENNKKVVMSYARTVGTLASSFGTIPYPAVVEMKKAIERIFARAELIHIKCPNGTNLIGESGELNKKAKTDVSMLRFPMVVPMPISARNFSGRVRLIDYLTSTGSRYYEPASVFLEEPIFVYIESGKINRFEGNSKVISRVESHYSKISKLFQIDKDIVHSWHAGIHPGITYDKPIIENPDRWSNTMFASPRYLHFHTCGDYAPGEICWMVRDPSILIDDKPLWLKGEICARKFPETSECLSNWPQLSSVYGG